MTIGYIALDCLPSLKYIVWLNIIKDVKDMYFSAETLLLKVSNNSVIPCCFLFKNHLTPHINMGLYRICFLGYLLCTPRLCFVMPVCPPGGWRRRPVVWLRSLNWPTLIWWAPSAAQRGSHWATATGWSAGNTYLPHLT